MPIVIYTLILTIFWIKGKTDHHLADRYQRHEAWPSRFHERIKVAGAHHRHCTSPNRSGCKPGSCP